MCFGQNTRHNRTARISPRVQRCVEVYLEMYGISMVPSSKVLGWFRVVLLLQFQLEKSSRGLSEGMGSHGSKFHGLHPSSVTV